jgi:hypothetical protein
MRPSTPRARQGRSLVGTLLLALTVATVLVGGSLGPAFGENEGMRDLQQGQDRYQRGHPPYRRGHPPVRREYQRSRMESQPYGYYAPPPVIYAPPPVVYAPPPSPGISLFFDLPFRHR